MTIAIAIRVHPYKATHFENRRNGKSIVPFIAFMLCRIENTTIQMPQWEIYFLL